MRGELAVCVVFLAANVRVFHGLERIPDYTLVDFTVHDWEENKHKMPNGIGFSSQQLYADLHAIFGDRSVQRSWTVLELGVGTGESTAVFADLFRQVIAVEGDEDILNTAAGRYENKSNIVWLTADIYRDAWFWSVIKHNSIQVALVDAAHGRELVLADLRACMQQHSLRYVIVHDFNFGSVREAVHSLRRDFELVAALGEARRAPLQERPPWAGRDYGTKNAEAVLLRPRRSFSPGKHDVSESTVASALQKFLADPDVAALTASAALPGLLDARAAAAPFTELCGAIVYVANDHDNFESNTLSFRFVCSAGAQGERGSAAVLERGPGSNCSKFGAKWWHMGSEDLPPEVGLPSGSQRYGWLKLQMIQTSHKSRWFAIVPGVSRGAFVLAPYGRGKLRIAIEKKRLQKSMHQSLGSMSPRFLPIWAQDSIPGPLMFGQEA